MHQMVDVSEFDNEYRPDLQLYHEICYELWFQIAQLFLRKTSFNFEI